MHLPRPILASVLLIFAACADKRPVRISVGTSDTVVINDTEPVLLPVRVFNAEGHILKTGGLRYEFASHNHMRISRNGRVVCDQVGDAEVHASLRQLSTEFQLLCRPVRELRSGTTMYLVVGDSAQDIPVGAIGLDGQPVTSFVASATIRDTTIATLDGMSVRPRSPGGTSIEVRVGEKSVGIGVWVYEHARTLEGLGRGRQTVAVPVRLASGATYRWHLPQGNYLLSILPDQHFQGRSALKLDAVGAKCTQAAFLGEQSYGCLAFSDDASVSIENPLRSEPAREFTGRLAVFRVPNQ